VSALFAQLRKQLLVVVAFNALRVDLYGGAKAGINQPEKIEFERDALFQFILGEAGTHEQRLPSRLGTSFRILIANLGQAVADFLIGGVLEIGRLHLFAQQLLIDEAIESAFAVFSRDAVQGLSGYEGFVTERILPVALKDDVAVDSSHDSIYDLGGHS